MKGRLLPDVPPLLRSGLGLHPEAARVREDISLLGVA